MAKSAAGHQERLCAIETLLIWEGRVSNARLRDAFAVHSTVASRDIAAYRKLAPVNLEPDASTQSFVASPFLKPALTQGKFVEYQRLIGAVGELTNVQAGVPVETVHMDATAATPSLFSKIHRSIRLGHALRIGYRSLTTPELHERIIRPHALIQAGTRWHVRAYCEKAAGFRDFNIGRMASAVELGASSLPGVNEDQDWATEVTFRLVPHSGLAGPQQQVVREEFMGGTTALVLTRRAPLVRYLIQTFHAAIDPERQCPPEYLLMVKEPEQLPRAALWRVHLGVGPWPV